MFSVIINIYNKKTKGPALMEYFTATGKLTLILLMWRIGWAPNSIPIYIQQDAKLHS
jgi:hypothetical protein